MLYPLYCRIVQLGLKTASPFLPWREPKLIEGENSLLQLPPMIKSLGLNRILIVTDVGISSLGLMNSLLTSLTEENISYFVYDKTIPNPTIQNVEEALQIYVENQCQGIIAFGGGSPMDCAKGVGARIARPNTTLSAMRGVLRVLKKTPSIFAIPTTAGTGSEVTLAAVVTDSQKHEKYAIMDTVLIPHYAVLDPLLTVNLPKHITSTTGMDALTHAVEAYIGRSNTKATIRCSEEAIQLIFENLYTAYNHGDSLVARSNMQKAAYLAGYAFTRAYVGNVHAIAHTLGGLYSIPHGLANAVILPYVLDYYGGAIYKKLARLATLVKVCNPEDTVETKAKKFILAIKRLNEDMNIRNKISGIQEKDIPYMVALALREANPLYPVPVIFKDKDVEAIIEQIRAE